MKPVNQKSVILVVTIIILAGAITGLLVMNNVSTDTQLFRFTDNEGNQLSATYYEGSLPIGVLIAEGFGSDQIAMQTITVELSLKGFHVFTFDFSGHGRSSGSIGFDNAQTDDLALQLLDALDEFSLNSGLQTGEIFILGHSLGSRVALQAQTMMNDTTAGLVLLGTQISLVQNTQSEFFTGTSDLDLQWIQDLGPDNPDTNILMLSSTWDDIIPTESAQLLYEKLSGDSISDDDLEASFTVGDTVREMKIYKRILHSFETYSPRMISNAINWIEEVASVTGDDTAPEVRIQTKIVLWIVGIVALLYLPVSVSSFIANKIKEGEAPLNSLTMDNKRRFFIWKFVMWLLSIPAMLVIFGVLFFLPLNLPVFSLTVLGFIGGYGLTNFVLYKLGRFPGTSGKWQFRPEESGTDTRTTQDILLAMGFGIVILVVTAIYSNTGFNYTYPLNQRFVWLIIISVINAFAYLVGNSELVWFYRQQSSSRDYTTLLLNALMPFFLLSVLYIVISSTSGLQGALLNLVEYGLTLTLGWFLQKKGNNIYVTSLLQSILLQWLVLTQGALFRF